VTQLVNSLEAKGMVERQADPADRRAVRLQLTERGKKVTRRAHAYMNTELSKLVEYLGEEESNQLIDLLVKVHAFAMNNPRPDIDRLPMNGDEKLD
jgi:DNA-binding MarR family transcriptional regulator